MLGALEHATTRTIVPEVVTLILDKLDAGDMHSALESGVFSIDADAERTRRRCQKTKKRQLAVNGDLAALKRIRKKRNVRFVLQDMALAAKNGHLDVVVWLHKHASGGYPCRILQEASAGGHLAVVRWLCKADRIAIRPGAVDAAIDDAARSGHDDVINYLATKHNGKGTPRALFWAVRNGHSSTIDRLCAIHPENAGAYYAVTCGDRVASIEMIAGDDKPKTGETLEVNVVAGDHQHGPFGLLDLACLMGRTDIVKLLWRCKNVRWTPILYTFAAGAHGTDVVDFLYVRRSALNAGIAPDEFLYKDTIAVAARDGSIAKVAAWHYAMSAPFTLSRSHMYEVARRGHLSMIKFLEGKGIVIRHQSCLWAACDGGSIAAAMHMIDAGAVIDHHAIKRAACHGHSDIVRLLFERGGSVRVDAVTLYAAVCHCDTDAVALIRNMGQAPTEPHMMIKPILRGDADMVAVLCDRPRTVGASEKNHAAAVACAVADGRLDIDDVLDAAIEKGNLPAIDALLDVRPGIWGMRPYRVPVNYCQRFHFDALSRVASRCNIVWDAPYFTVHDAITLGGLHAVRWFHARGLLNGIDHDLVASAAPSAANNGHLSTVEFLWEHGFRPTLMEPPSCDECDDEPAEDHHAAEAFLRRKIAEAAGDCCRGAA